jgi:hypothetical protein
MEAIYFPIPLTTTFGTIETVRLPSGPLSVKANVVGPLCGLVSTSPTIDQPAAAAAACLARLIALFSPATTR